jgi:hypothetical protein
MRKAPALLATALWLVSLGGPVACSTTVSQEEVTQREIAEDRDARDPHVGESSEQAAEEETYWDVDAEEDR